MAERNFYRILIILTALSAVTGCFSYDLLEGELTEVFLVSSVDFSDVVSGLTVEEPETIEEEEEIILPEPNEIGDIMIIMYHSVTSGEPDTYLERTVDELWQDLTTLYHNGYRLISMADLVNNNITVEKGYTPVILTFDDGWSSAFSLEEKDGVLVPAENCGVDVINRFCEEYPDFGKGAVFYINGYLSAFNGAGTLYERFTYLVENGYELGNHTYSHVRLLKQSQQGIQNEIMGLEQFVRDVLADYEMLTLAYPYGERPKQGLREFALKGEGYEYKLALREGPSGASAAPNHINFDSLNVPRVRGTDCDHMDLGWYLTYYEENPHLKYISDGNPETISVPGVLEGKVNYDSLEGKELILY